MDRWTSIHNYPLNFIDIIFSAPHLSITLTNSSTEIRSSWKDHQAWSTCTINSNYWLTSDLSISSMNLSAILLISFLSRPSTIIVRTATSSFLIENDYWPHKFDGVTFEIWPSPSRSYILKEKRSFSLLLFRWFLDSFDIGMKWARTWAKSCKVNVKQQYTHFYSLPEILISVTL